MNQSTGDVCPASVLFNLPGFQVVHVRPAEPGELREVVVQATAVQGACPSCGVFSGRVHQWTVQRLADVDVAGPVQVWWEKRRWLCAEPLCSRRTFAETTEQVPARARLTVRLKRVLLAELEAEGVPVKAVASAHRLSWPTVWRVVVAAAVVVDASWQARRTLVTALGVDEHRFARVRWFKDEAGRTRRVEPWTTVFTDLTPGPTCGRVIGVVAGRGAADVSAWLMEQPRWWRRRVQVVALDMSASYRSVVRRWLPRAAVSVDRFHLVKLANLMVTLVRQRLSWELRARRGRAVDAGWAHRRLLLRGADNLSERGWAKLWEVFATDDPTEELRAAWAVKERLRILLTSTTVEQAREQKTVLVDYVRAAATAETDKLLRTVNTWWPEIETFIATRVTNARTEAANLTCKNIKRAGRGYRSHHNYRARIIIHNAGQTPA